MSAVVISCKVELTISALHCCYRENCREVWSTSGCYTLILFSAQYNNIFEFAF